MLYWLTPMLAPVCPSFLMAVSLAIGESFAVLLLLAVLAVFGAVLVNARRTGRKAYERSIADYERLVMNPIYVSRIPSPSPDSEVPLPPKRREDRMKDAKLARRRSRRAGLFAPDLLRTALTQAFVMLRPDIQWKNPVMFVVEVGTVLSILYTIAKAFGSPSEASLGYLIALDIWLFLTVVFANFASALAEARGKAQADALRKTRAGDARLSPAESRGRPARAARTG